METGMEPGEHYMYPYTDAEGRVWLSAAALSIPPQPCFICKQGTGRYDVWLDVPFCNSPDCRAVVYPGNPDVIGWENEGGSVR